MSILKHLMQGASDDVASFLRDERGTTAIEYGLIASLVAVGMLVGLRALGDGNSSSWGRTATTINNAMQ